MDPCLGEGFALKEQIRNKIRKVIIVSKKALNSPLLAAGDGMRGLLQALPLSYAPVPQPLIVFGAASQGSSVSLGLS